MNEFNLLTTTGMILATLGFVFFWVWIFSLYRYHSDRLRDILAYIAISFMIFGFLLVLAGYTPLSEACTP